MDAVEPDIESRDVTDQPGCSIDGEYLTTILVGLVGIDSRNPSLTPGAPGEAEIAAFVADAMRVLGLQVEAHESEPGRVSVVGRLPGRGGGRSLMLNAHLDTVGVEGMEAPFAARIEDGRLYGRGAYDMKGSLAACLTAVHALVESGAKLDGDLLIAAVADEEYASLGTSDILARYRVDGAIVTEPTELGVCLAHKGFVWVEVETLGRAAHGSRYEEGIDANLRMGRFLARLEELERDLRARPPHRLVGPPSLHAATLHGGTGLSTYAERCVLRIERRTVPGETQAIVEAEIAAILDRLRAEDPGLRIASTTIFVRDPFEANLTSPIARAVESAVGEVLGRAPAKIGASYWMDAALYGAAGIDTVVIGPAGEGAHAAVEWVDLESCERVAGILARTAIAYCRAGRLSVGSDSAR
jgi:acetylornithine deacetylase